MVNPQCPEDQVARDVSCARPAGELTRGIVRVPALPTCTVGFRLPACDPTYLPFLISGSPFPRPSGHCAVVREGLTNPWIPDNWSWGGVASEHCPVLAEFYVEKDWNKKEGPRSGNGVTLERSEANIKHER